MRRRVRRREDRPKPAGQASAAERQIFTKGDISGIASAGDYAVNIQNRAEQMTTLPAEAFARPGDVPAPPGLTNLPGRPGLFVGRAGELARLDAALAGPGGVVVQAVHGLGGIGKSTLAAHWAVARAASHTLAWWITADSSASIDDGLARLAGALQPALASVLPAEALRDRAVQWLAAHTGWLVVLDNVTAPADIAPLLAQAATGRFLITSRRTTGWHNLADPVRLGVLAPAEALDMLTQIMAGAGLGDLGGAAEVCAELGFLPLAIEQAGAYLAQAGINARDYLDLLEAYPADMYQATAEGGDAARTIARIWHVTLNRLADEPLTGQILRILAWYAPDDIPRALLDGVSDPSALTSAIGRLAAYSMITATPKAIAVHRLVQAVTRTPGSRDNPHRDPQAIDTACDQATAQLCAALPDDDPAQWPAWRTLLPHIKSLATHTRPERDDQTIASLLGSAGSFLAGQGRVALATQYFQRALADLQHLMGPDHPDTLIAITHLARAYRAAGDLNQAISLFEQNRADTTRVLGPDNPQTLTTIDDLARAYRDAGDLNRAISLREQNLADYQRVMGPDNPHTLTAIANLASVYLDAGDLNRATPLLEQNLADSTRILGPDHPNTLIAIDELARAYRNAGDLNRAIPLFEQRLADATRVMGPDNPHTLSAMANLACAYLDAGDLNRATPLLEQNLADSTRVLDLDLPHTLTVRGNLASAYQDAGDLNRAIPLREQNLADTTRVMGPDNPGTLTAKTNLASAYQAAGDPKRAIPLFKQNLADSTRVLGPDHPHTLITITNLAGAYLEAGDLNRAIPLFEQSLADTTRVMGPDNPHTLTAISNLAGAYQAAGDLNLATPLHELNLADYQRVMGPDHPHTLSARNYLAGAYQAAGDLNRAIPLLEEGLADSTRVLGPDHPDTLAFRSNLARAHLAAGDPKRAIPLFEQSLADDQRVLGPDHPHTLSDRNDLAGAYFYAGERRRAVTLFEQSLANHQRVLGPDHPHTLSARENLAATRRSPRRRRK
jgi:tetratricopeptide (TPR) repeat protein